jgi:aryl-alcohol dehydrogenase-like predicted oxidoreductase
MRPRPIGQTGLFVSPIGYGSFKIGRNTKTKYPQSYDLPDEDKSIELLRALLPLGITYVDTAPAYGLSEERIGKALASSRSDLVLSTKVGESFENGISTYDFSASDGAERDAQPRSFEDGVARHGVHSFGWTRHAATA